MLKIVSKTTNKLTPQPVVEVSLLGEMSPLDLKLVRQMFSEMELLMLFGSVFQPDIPVEDLLEDRLISCPNKKCNCKQVNNKLQLFKQHFYIHV